jgi:hypothetical protein
MLNGRIPDEVWELSYILASMGCTCHHNKRDAHGSSCTQEVSEAIMCGTSVSTRGTAAQWQSEKMNNTPFKA